MVHWDFNNTINLKQSRNSKGEAIDLSFEY
jgi:hypothetical protein